MRRVVFLLALVVLLTTCKNEQTTVEPTTATQTETSGKTSPTLTRPEERPTTSPTLGKPSPVPVQVQFGTLTVAFGPDGGDRIFNVNGQPYGHVNVPTRINAGTYTIDLGEPRDYEPAHLTVAVDELQPSTIAFRRVSP